VETAVTVETVETAVTVETCSMQFMRVETASGDSRDTAQRQQYSREVAMTNYENLR
jgi:hypothetical protein